MSAISLLKWKIMETKLRQIQVTQEEINQATRPNVYRNRKKYTRKQKHRNSDIDN